MSIPLSQKSKDLAQGGLAWGATNSGKSFGACSQFARYATKVPGKHLLIGSNLRLLRGEIIPNIRNIARHYGVPSTKYNSATGTFTVGSSLIIVVAGAKSGDEDRIRTWHGVKSLYGEEVSALLPDFWDMGVTRMALPFGPKWATCNPTVPTSWVKERLDDGRWGVDRCFYVKDNPTLTEAQVEEFESQFSGTFRLRMIEALWVAPEGLIYPVWQDWGKEFENDADYDRNLETLRGRNCFIGADYGESSVTCAAYIQMDDKQRFVVTGEYYWNAYKQGERNSTEHVTAIKANAPGPIVGTWPDPTARDLKDSLSKAGLNVNLSYNKIDGYGIVDGMLQKQQLIVAAKKCPNLVNQMYSLIWSKNGDRPDPSCIDHMTDSLRYVGCGIAPLRQNRFVTMRGV